ncbi:MAG: LptF/LptG family permease [gamma proteobacterium symbiont of Bathyaustriella thionipta]|nr:LptF/LptG family permease [gamma proteobacterium symbiont of Bathyaustriella thionipta]
MFFLGFNRFRSNTIYEFDDDKRMKLTTHAQAAVYKDNAWHLQNIVQTGFSEERAFTRSVDEAKWQSLLNPALLNVVVAESKFMPVWELYRYINFLKDNGRVSVKYEVVFWKKMLTPFVTLVMMLLAIPFVFGNGRSISMGQRVFSGVLVSAGFYLLNSLFGYLAQVYSMNSLLAVAFPGIFFLAVSMWLFRRVH